jgi:hypothetical protein
VRAGRAAVRNATRHTDLLTLVALTGLALALRVPLVDQSLTLDEPHSWLIAKGGFGDIFRELRAGYEIHPPLYFVLAWLAGKVGDPAVWVRMPSLVLGTACVPLTYMLGLRTVGRTAAAAGSAMIAISPFAIHYSADARPYAALMFFCLASTLALTAAVDSRRTRWWALYALMACAALYTHYFAAFVLVAQAGWLFLVARDHLRAYALSCAAVAAGYMPWLPSILDQPHTTSDYAGLVPLSLSWLGKQLVSFFPGNGLNPASALPGSVALGILGVALAVLIGSAMRGKRPRWTPRPSDPIALLLLVTAATPVALVLFSLGGDNVALARYLGPVLPPFSLLLGALLLKAPRRVTPIALVAVLGVLAVGTARGYESRFARTDYKGAARYLESEVRPGDLVLEFSLAADSANRVRVSPIDLNFERDLPVVTIPASEAERHFQDVPRSGRVFVAGTDYGAFLQLPRPAPEDGLCAVRRAEFNGFVAVFAYEHAVAPGAGTRPRGAVLARGGRVLRLASGTELPIAPGGVRGNVDRVAPAGPAAGVGIDAWAIDANARPAGCLLAFSGRRLVGFGLAGKLRPDLSEAFGRSAEGAGFELQTAPGADPARLRVIAVADGKAAELAHPTAP